MKKIHRNNSLKQLTLSILVVLASAALLIGVTMAWLTYQYRLSSIGKIHPPTYISILEPGDTDMQSIDLSYDKSEVHDGRVELKRPIVIRSEKQQYDLCIAHTTNISGLSISLYEAVAVENVDENKPYLAGITEKGTPYYWNKKDGETTVDLFTQGVYLNKLSGDSVVADQTHQAHNVTFRLTEEYCYDHVQKNAEPLYWVKKGLIGVKRTPDDGNFYTNYILEITWNETDKETDILYVIAQTSNETVSESSGSHQEE